MDDDDLDTAWEAREASRDRHFRRMVYLDCADGYLALARKAIKRHRDARRACRLLLKSAAAYQEAGLTRRGRTVWRYARLIHAAQWREVGQ